MEAPSVEEITFDPKAAIAMTAQLTVFGVHGVHGEAALRPVGVVPERGGRQCIVALNVQGIT